MYGNRTSGEIYSLPSYLFRLSKEYVAIYGDPHLLGGFAGGQAEYVPLGDVNLKISDNFCGPFMPYHMEPI